ncbi:MAG: hypothetical protein ACFFDH_00735 [Promethearchaeota archaeon]
MNVNTKKNLIRLLISILLVVIIWSVFVGILFIVSPNFICMTRIDEDIRWEIESFEPTETDPGGINIDFYFKYEMWINTPLPFVHNVDGCHIKPRAEAILTNTSISDEILRYDFGCYLALVPQLFLPGIEQKAGSINYWLNYTDISELPEGLYTFWVDYSSSLARAGSIKSFKTYMNVTEEGATVYSDDSGDYQVWFWIKLISSIAILIGSVLVVYIVLVIRGKRKTTDN